MTFDPETVLDHIDIDELVKVTLDLANIDSPTGNEGPVADYVHEWLTREGFHARKVGLYPDRRCFLLCGSFFFLKAPQMLPSSAPR